MQNILTYLHGDRVIWIITLLMLAFSLISVYSFVPILIKIEGGTASKYLFKHLIYVGMSLGAMYWVHKKNVKYISQLSKFLFYLSVALLIFTFFFGAKINNAGRWVRIPFVGLTFQSSDFARLALIIYLSRLLVKKKDLLNKWKEGILPIVLPIIIICGLIVKDNFSTAAILFFISLILLFLGRIPWKKWITIIGGGISLLFFIILIHKTLPNLNLLPRYETWENRFINHINDDNNVIANAQSLNAQLAIYSGSLIGKGVGDGELKEYLPEAYADFYYASFVEEFGLISAIILIMLYLILLYRIMRIGLKSNDLFDTYLCIGIGILILSQCSVNMLVCTGIFPVTGQNMPLLAMGGSALMITCISLGIVQSIANKQDEKTGTISK
ncbi:MAG: cell division protein FtsW [Crocinitomicaceae bacterium]|nr:cell division protein FtsW [Crocinitomicaceae bacterium]|tara:strand:- start:13421 stop:14575 length:1155 start_codon:yes stop_codon:yes gene_type:complete